MGWVDERLGNKMHDHEGYVAHALTDGTWVTIDAASGKSRKNRLRAECTCGWHSPQTWDHDTPDSTYPSDALETEIMQPWEDHITERLDTTRTEDLAHVKFLLGKLGENANRPVTPETLPGLERVLDVTLRLVRRHRHSADTD